MLDSASVAVHHHLHQVVAQALAQAHQVTPHLVSILFLKTAQAATITLKTAQKNMNSPTRLL